MSSDKLFEGDFTNTEHWPKIKYGLPDKADILDAQHQTMAKFMIKEAEKREADQKMNAEKFDQLYALTAAIADKLEVDESTIKAAKPTKATASTQKASLDKQAVTNLSQGFQDEMLILTGDYVDASGKKASELLKQTDSKSVDKKNLVGQWAKHIKEKLRHVHENEWKGLNEVQRKLLYIVISKQYFKAAKVQGQTEVQAQAEEAPSSGSESVTPSAAESARSSKRRKTPGSYIEQSPRFGMDGATPYVSTHTVAVGKTILVRRQDGTYEERTINDDASPQSWTARPYSRPSLGEGRTRPRALLTPTTHDTLFGQPLVRQTSFAAPLPPSPILEQRNRQQSVFQKLAAETDLPAEAAGDDSGEDDEEEVADVTTKLREPFSSISLSGGKYS